MTTDPLREGLNQIAADAARSAYSDDADDLTASLIRVANNLVRLAETAPAVGEAWDEVGGAMWFDRHQWGVIIDGLILQRAEAEARKATNEYSNSDERAAMCVDLIERINAEDTLATPPPAPVAGVEVTDAMVERAARALVRDSARSAGHEPSEAEIAAHMGSGVRAEARAALIAALTPEES